MNMLSQILRDHNLRKTQARKEIYELLKKSQFSLSAKEVFEKMGDKPRTDLVSVYRNLSLFADLGLAHRFQDGKYASCDHDHNCCSREKSQMHFINHCRSCGKSSEIKVHTKELKQIAKQLMKISEMLTSYNEILVQGLCNKCSDS